MHPILVPGSLTGPGVPRFARSWMLTLVLAMCWLVLGPATPDLAAQIHRAGLFGAQGFTVWDNTWYDGHHVPGYSLVFPPVSAVLGVRLTGAIAAVASAALFESLVRGRRAEAARWWFAVGCVADLVIGRLTYALGVTAGLAAIAALTRRRSVLAAVLAVACAATSPVAGLFLALAGIGFVVVERRADAVPMSAAAVATALALSVAFPEGGTQPFALGSLAAAVGVSLLAAVSLGRRPLRDALLLYVAAVVACYAIASPMGSNVTRLGTAFLAPVLLVAARPASPARRAVLIVTLVAAAAWQWAGPFTQGARAWGDRSSTPGYYRPLMAELRRQDASAGRVEVPFTRDHWETVYLAQHYALARGWERQLDRRLNPLFYRGRLDAAAYGRWLRANAVRYVALADGPLDVAGRREAAIVAARPSFLQPVWHDAHWRLFRVRDPLPLAAGGAARVHLGASDLRLDVRRPGPILLRVHWTPYWRVTAGSGCVARRGRWTMLDVPRPGTLVLSARFSVGRLLDGAAACRPRSAGGRG